MAYQVKEGNTNGLSSDNETQGHYDEFDHEVKSDLDAKYANIPVGYVHQKVDFIYKGKRSSSNSWGFSSLASSRFRNRSDSQVAVDTMLHWLVDPGHCEDVDREDLDLNTAKQMISTNGEENTNRKSSMKFSKQTRKYRRISWPDQEKNENISSSNVNTKPQNQRKNSRSNSLEVILEYDV